MKFNLISFICYFINELRLINLTNSDGRDADKYALWWFPDIVYRNTAYTTDI